LQRSFGDVSFSKVFLAKKKLSEGSQVWSALFRKALAENQHERAQKKAQDSSKLSRQ